MEAAQPTRVFLSYARGDDESFVARLHADLTAQGFDCWFDRASMPSRALTFHQEIKDAIRARDRLVLVIGPRAAVSDYVIEEWRFAWESEKSVVPILRLGDRSLIPAPLKFFHCEDFRADEEHGYDFHLKQLVRILSEPAPPLGKLVAVPSLPPHFLAQPDRLRALKDAILTDLHKPVVITGAASRVGLHGMGGIGKSVLACVLAHDRQVRQSFPDGILWLSFGQQPDLVQLQRIAAVALGGDGFFDNESLGKAQLLELLKDRAVLLVLDDVWDARHSEAFDVSDRPRCRTILTTRDAGLIQCLRATEYRVELLSDAQALSLLAKASGTDPADLPSEAQEVARECDHLPLALTLCGGMSFGPDGIGWSAILSALRSAELEEIATDHPLAGHHASLWRAVTLSVQQLAPQDQQRFFELAVFPEDETVPEAAVRTLWSHTSGMKPIAQEKLLKRLAQRNLIYLDTDRTDSASPVRRVSLHDLLHDYAKRLAGDSIVLHEKMVEGYRSLCPQGWASGPNDGWYLQHLQDHLCAAQRTEECAILLLELPWLERKVDAGLTYDLPADFQMALRSLPTGHPQAPFLRLIREAVRRDIHLIARHAHDYPQGLFQCVWNTGWWHDCPEAAEHYEPLEDEDLIQDSNESRPKLSTLLESWRRDSRRRNLGSPWLRSLRPPILPLDSGQVSVLEGQSDNPHLAFSPDSRLVASSDGHEVRMWEVGSGKNLWVGSGDELEVRCLAFSPDGRRIVAGQGDGSIRVWDIESGGQFDWAGGHTGAVEALVFTNAGKTMVSGALDGTFRFWNLGDWSEIPSLRLHAREASSAHDGDFQVIAICPTGASVAVLSDSQLRIWATAGKMERVSIETRGTINGIVFSPDGTCIVVCGKDGATFWNTSNGEQLKKFEETGGFQCLAFSADGRRVVSGTREGTVRIRDAENGYELATLRGHASAAIRVTFSACGNFVLSGSWDQSIRVWEAANRKQSPKLYGHDETLWKLITGPDGKSDLVQGAFYREYIRRLNEMRMFSTGLAMAGGRACQILCVAFSHGGKLAASGSEDKTIRIWSCETGKLIRTLVQVGHSGVTGVSFCPDGLHLASAGDNQYLWDIESGESSSFKSSGISASVACSPDGRRIAGGWFDGKIRIWDVASLQELASFQAHEKSVTGLAFTADGSRIASNSYEKFVSIWDAHRFECLEVIENGGSAAIVAFRTHGQPFRLVAGQSETVLEDAATGGPVAYLPLALDRVSAHPSGRMWAGAKGHYFALYQLEEA